MKASPIFLVTLGLVFVLGFMVLASTLWRLQVTHAGDALEEVSDQSLRRIRMSGLRGRILDANGNVLADCRASRDIVFLSEAFRKDIPLPKAIDALDEAVGSLSSCLKRPRLVNRDAIARHFTKESPLPLTVQKNLNDSELAVFAEHAREFAGFDVDVVQERVYPFGQLAAHVLGYVAHDSHDAAADETQYHFPGKDLKGRSGIEAYYNAYLTGSSGERRVTVDARGFAIEGTNGAPSSVERPAANGPDLVLTIDAKLQLALERELNGVCGAGVVIDPRSGAIMAMASAPAYDPNLFIPSISQKDYDALSNDERHPLINRAVGGVYAPGSTFKPITALAACYMGINPNEQFDCKGVYKGTRCWDMWGHGPLDLSDALKHSCNAFFLHLGEEVGGDKVLSVAKLFGLGKVTGIDLRGEAGGSVDPWVFQSAIGQGKIQVTPLQMAIVAATLGNRGKLYRPYLHRQNDAEIRPAAEIAIDGEDFDLVREGMLNVVRDGTGRRIAERTDETRQRYRIRASCAGKTGTAEVGIGANRHKNTWIIAFAPFENPTVAIAMVVEHGESGGKTTAPKVYNVLKHIFGEEKVVRSGGKA